MTYTKAQLIGQAGKGVLLQQRADELVNKAQLLASAEVQQVRQDTGALGPGAVLKMLPDLGQEEVLVVRRVAPVRLLMRRAGRCGRCGRRWRRARELLIEVGGGCGHARSGRAPQLPLLLGDLIQPRIQGHVGVQV